MTLLVLKVWNSQLYTELCLSLETTALLSAEEEMKGNAARNSLTLQGKNPKQQQQTKPTNHPQKKRTSKVRP